MGNNAPDKKYYEFTDIKSQKKYQIEKSPLVGQAAKGKIDIFNVDFFQFTQLYFYKISPLFLERYTKQAKELQGIKKALGCSFFILFALLFLPGVNYVPLFFIFIFLILFCFLVYFAFFKPFDKMIMYDFKEIFFSLFNVEYSRYFYMGNSSTMKNYEATTKNLMAKAWELCEIMKKLGLNSSFGVDETLALDYNGKKLVMTELSRLTNSKSCMIIYYSVNKNFEKETIIKNVEDTSSVNFTAKPQIYLEDPLFNKNFKIFADDQVEARYLLTPTFMERLLNFQKKYNCTTSVLFSKNTPYPESNIFLAITSYKDFFEIPKGVDWIKNSSHFYNICQEIKDILKIIDALKLDQDIGL